MFVTVRTIGITELSFKSHRFEVFPVNTAFQSCVQPGGFHHIHRLQNQGAATDHVKQMDGQYLISTGVQK
jgi:hypothetical protein